MSTAITPSLRQSAVAEALALIEKIETFAAQARARLTTELGHAPEVPVLDAETTARVENLGPVAQLHLAHIEAHGSMTRADSLAIRRRLYGENVRSTANLFGLAGSGTLFWRDRPHRSPVANDDPIRMTEEGERIALLWRQLHPAEDK